MRLTVVRPTSLGGRRGSSDASKCDANSLPDRRTREKKIIGAARPRSGWRGASGSDVVKSNDAPASDERTSYMSPPGDGTGMVVLGTTVDGETIISGAPAPAQLHDSPPVA